jgi:multisubunit Na+/H+ antiporter MnhC subunit
MIPMENLAKYIIGAGVVLVLAGGVLLLLGRLGIQPGELPGDIHVEGERTSFRFPLVTCLILSAILTVLLNVLMRFWR